jgi:hypothetical protein
MSDDLGSAQEALGRAIDRARIGEDRALANQVRELGERLAHLLCGLIRMTRLHAPENHAFDQPVADLHTTLVKLDALLGTVHLVAVEDLVYVNDVRVRAGEKTASIKELSLELYRHNVGGITFHEPLTGPQIRTLLGCLAAAPSAHEPRNSLARILAQKQIAALELQGRFRFRDTGEAQQAEADPRDVVARATAAVDEAFQNLAAGRVPHPLALRRIVAELLRLDLGAEGFWVDPVDAPSHALHAFRVTHLSLLLGKALGLPENVLQDLGVAALYHDAGYAAGEPGLPAAVAFEAHPAAGAYLMLRQRGFHEAKLRRVLALLHHHRDADDAEARPGLIARIIRIAEDYDTLSRRRGNVAPSTALALMLRWAGSRYDTALLHLFLNLLGAYPPGTLLQLDDGRVVRSISIPSDAAHFATPLTRCLRQADGQPAPEGLPVIPLARSVRPKVLRPCHTP